MANFEELIRRAEVFPGALKRRSTIVQAGFLVPESRESYIVETIATTEGVYIFLDIVDAQGQAHRLGLPPKVVQALYHHQKSILEARKSQRGQRAAQTRKAKGIVPFKGKDQSA